MIVISPAANGKELTTTVQPWGTNTYENVIYGVGSYATGENFRNDYLPIQKGDGIHAMPWKWSHVIQTPSEYPSVFLYKRVERSAGDPSLQKVRHVDLRPQMYITAATASVVKTLTSEQRRLVDETAILKALASTNKSNMSLPLIWRERKKTVSTMKDYSYFILNNMITMQRKDVKKWLAALKKRTRPEQLKRLANQIANRHLEFVFGVLPIIDEINSLAEDLMEPYSSVRTGRGRMRLVIESDGTEYQQDVGSWNKTRFVDKYYHDYSVRVNLRYNITSDLINESSKLGVNPFYYWYDNTPLSFVVGWFSNFNTWVQALDSNEGLTYETGSMSKKDVRRIERFMKPFPDKTTVYSQGYLKSERTACLSGELNSKAEFISFERLVYENPPPLPGLRFLDKTSFFTHAASVSLMIQRFVKEHRELETIKPFRYRGPKVRNLPPIKYRKV